MSLEAVIRRDRIVTAAGLLAVTALAWLYLLREPTSHVHAVSASRMEAMAAASAAEHGVPDDSDLPD